MSTDLQHNELIRNIKALIAQTLNISLDQISGELSYGDLPEWDSLGHMNIMMALEQKYGIQITAEIIKKLVNIRAIVAHIVEYDHV